MCPLKKFDNVTCTVLPSSRHTVIKKSCLAKIWAPKVKITEEGCEKINNVFHIQRTVILLLRLVVLTYILQFFKNTYLKKSFSNISSIAFNWQNIKARCWFTTISSVCSPLGTPMPQSINNCL